MESPYQTQACSMSSGLRMSILQRNSPSLLPDLRSNSSFYKISNETLPYVSGIFDETMDPSFMSNEPVAAVNLPDQKNLKPITKTQDEVISETREKAAYNNGLSLPIENDHTIEFSMSMISAQEDDNNVTEADPKGDTLDVSCHSLESTHSIEKTKNQSKNSTFDMAKDLKDKFSGLNLTKLVSNKETGSSNVTFEKSVELQEKSSGLSCTISNDDASVDEKHANEEKINSTVDVYGLSNFNTERTPNQKLNGTVDIIQSIGSKHEQSSEERSCSAAFQKESTLTKPTEKANITIDLGAGIGSSDVVQPVNLESVNRTFSKHSTIDHSPSEPVSDSITNTTVNIVQNANTDLAAQSNANCSVSVKDTPFDPVSTAAPAKVDVVVCSDRTLDLCKEEPQSISKRKNGTSDGDAYLNLDISQSSMFSLDEMLDMKPCPLVASTPIVLGRGFDRLGSARHTNVQKQLSVITSINTQPNNDSAGNGDHEGSDATKTDGLSVKSDGYSQIQIPVSANGSSCSTTSEAAFGNKPLSKTVVRKKIQQPSLKSNIPKTQLPPRPSTLKLPSAVVKSKTAAGAQALNQLETSSSALHSIKRTVQINKVKTLAPVKNISAGANVKSLSVEHRTSVSNTTYQTSDKKAGAVCTTLPKPSSLQPPGRGRFGFKPPGCAVSSEETGHIPTNNKSSSLLAMRTRSSLLPGFALKHASVDALPLAKRKKTDLLTQPNCSSSNSGTEEGVQKNVPAFRTPDITSNRHNNDCGTCTLLQEKLHSFHEELGEFLQEPDRSADCKKWVSIQHKLESYIVEVRHLQTDHH